MSIVRRGYASNYQILTKAQSDIMLCPFIYTLNNLMGVYLAIAMPCLQYVNIQIVMLCSPVCPLPNVFSSRYGPTYW